MEPSNYMILCKQAKDEELLPDFHIKRFRKTGKSDS
jgi:hypothetical protein